MFNALNIIWIITQGRKHSKIIKTNSYYRLDSRPKKMFENFIRRTLEDNVYKITYLDDLKLFEFGPIFVGANR